MVNAKGFELHRYGQSIWLDYISRSLLKTGTLGKLIELGFYGMTSNPTIFDKAISGANDYDTQIGELCALGKSTFEIYDELTIRDIRDAADIFKPVYDKTEGLDGYVSLEINPKLAYSTEETIEEGKRLYRKVDRPNLMLKVPSTKEGFPAIEELVAFGINVNVTLIFSLNQYIETAEAYMRGVGRLIKNNGNPRSVRSVASVFVSRIDTLCDRLIDEKVKEETDLTVKEELVSLKGKAAAANSALIYEKFRELFFSEKFNEFSGKGAHIQRVLWGSTSTKNPDYSDIKYVTELIGKDTVNTMPRDTFDAFLDHGCVEGALPRNVREILKVLHDLNKKGIDINRVCERLLQDGVRAFEQSFTSLLGSIEKKAAELRET